MPAASVKISTRAWIADGATVRVDHLPQEVFEADGAAAPETATVIPFPREPVAGTDERGELLEVLRPAMERNVKRKREEIKRKNRAERRKRVAASRKRRVNRFLSEAGIPLRVL